MGNCWRMPEDHSSLLPSHSSNSSSSGNFTTVIISNIDTSIPKLVTTNRIFADLDAIKAAQCRNILDRLPLIKYDSIAIKQTECAICLLDFNDNELVRKLPCDGAHVFHPSCIDQWFQKSLTCPHCSVNVDAAILLQFVHHSTIDDDE